MIKSIVAIDWMPDETLVTMSEDGELNIWAAVAGAAESPDGTNATGSLEFVQRRIKMKDKAKSPPMTVMSVCGDNLLITGDQSGVIKSWNINMDMNEFKLFKSYDVSTTGFTNCLTGFIIVTLNCCRHRKYQCPTDQSSIFAVPNFLIQTSTNCSSEQVSIMSLKDHRSSIPTLPWPSTAPVAMHRWSDHWP